VFCGGGNECYDELDHDTCEDGFVDKGLGVNQKRKRMKTNAQIRLEAQD
jgi:hypothetical protein